MYVYDENTPHRHFFHLVGLARVPERPGGASSFGGVVQREGRVELRWNLLQPFVVGGELSEHAERVALELCPQLLRDRGAAMCNAVKYTGVKYTTGRGVGRRSVGGKGGMEREGGGSGGRALRCLPESF